mgnify:FL=1
MRIKNAPTKMGSKGRRLFRRNLRTFLRKDTMQAGGFIAKQSSWRIFKGCFLKATGLIPRFFLDGRINDCAVKGATAGAVEGTPGCHGEGLELPTSLPASEAEN